MLSSFSILFLNILWIHYLYSEFNMNRLSFSWIYYEPINFFVNRLSMHYVSFICIAHPLWVQYVFAISLEIDDLFCKFTTGILFAITLMFSQNHCRFNISFVNLLWTINFFVNRLSIHYESFLGIANLLEIHGLFCKFTTCILFEITLIFRKITVYSIFLS